MTSRRALLIDAVATSFVGAAACMIAHRTSQMTWVIALTYVARMVAWSRLPRNERPVSMWFEIPFTLACAFIGGLNDWNTVVRHHIYAYRVPSDLLPLSSIPLWMLAYWGLVLRLVTSLALFDGLGPIGPPSAVRGLRGPHPRTRMLILIAIVLVTRQAIYRLWTDSLWSWLPFAIALALHAVLLPWGKREKSLAFLTALLGPIAEALLIQVAELHHYSLGMFFGVPLWIGLWWVLGALIWAEVSRNFLHWFGSHPLGIGNQARA